MSDEVHGLILRTLERMDDRQEALIVKVAKIEEKLSWSSRLYKAAIGLVVAITGVVVAWTK